ncbi:hypothetical protein LMH87_000001 [Akanthomyces muscarius]|uniref:Uncharacterized protein n=1 Tax=Akanthomyces muscarius TaxID=2231603 RepID=A0A9W8QEF8_AKAMU|nr:hypothetical protein LMH87_000001 [Akanthomyces muscarius]KAJ4154721.1 hypothetical protein LMH87_000001 [Akanthomyces muscarius]
MTPAETVPASLLRLPWEIRSVILIDALEFQLRREPIFDRKFMRSRVRLGNLFDERHPKATNIYIEKPGTWPLALSARALQATNRQLRDEVTLLINETFKTGKARAAFILDMMIVKDIGVFPTWLCFPYKTKRILSLRVNLRIIRPDPTAVPVEWAELARYPANIHPRWGELKPSTFWNFFAVLALISLSRLRYEPAVDETGIKPAAAPTNKHMTRVLDAYLVPMEATPPDGRPIVPGLEDKSRNGPFYKQGYMQFGREVFHDDTDYSDSWETHELNLKEKAAGRVASGQLLHHVWECIPRITDYKEEEDELALYQYALANSVGEVTYSPPVGPPPVVNTMYMMYKNTESWISSYECDGDWRTMNISKAIAKEEASEDPARGYIAILQLAKRRRALGWQAQFDLEYETFEKARREKDKQP